MLNKLIGIAENASDHGLMVDHMLELAHWFMLILFVGWAIFFTYVLIRFRKKRNPKADYHGVHSHASTHLEIGVIIIDAFLLLALAIPMWATQVDSFPDENKAVRVHVVAEQFAFNIHYPGADGKFGRQNVKLVSSANPLGLDLTDPDAQDDIITRNNLYLPVGVPAILDISSKDMVHNVSIYKMRASQDATPGSQIPIWFTPIKTGESEIICGQLCGTGHFAMKAMLTVVTQGEFDDWLKQQAPKPQAEKQASTQHTIASDKGI